MLDDERKKDIGEVVSVLLNLNDYNRQLVLYGAQLLEKSELMTKIQQAENKSAQGGEENVYIQKEARRIGATSSKTGRMPTNRIGFNGKKQEEAICKFQG